MSICSFQLCFCAEQHNVQISSKNGNREIQGEEKRKIISALVWLSELEDLALARFHHKIYNLKWHPVYPAVFKQLLLKITSVYFFSALHMCLRERYVWELFTVVFPTHRVALLCTCGFVGDISAIQTAHGLRSHPRHWQVNCKPGRWRCS